jgi:hypothetical protein
MKYESKGKKKKKNLYDQMMKRKSKPMKGYGS